MAHLISWGMNFLKSLLPWRPVGGSQSDQICSEVFQSKWLLSAAIRRKNDVRHPENQPPYAKVVVFIPRLIEYNRRLELSSFCIEAMCEDDAWNHLGQHCGKGLTHPIYGRADFAGSVCASATPALSLDPDWTPPRHVNILGWEGQKCSQLSQAQVIRAASRSHLNPKFSLP
jgi:hypothetical protein